MTNPQKATAFNLMLLQYRRGHRGMPYRGPKGTEQSSTTFWQPGWHRKRQSEMQKAADMTDIHI